MLKAIENIKLKFRRCSMHLSCTLLLPQGHEDIGTSSSTRVISRLLIKTLKSLLHHFNDLQLLQIIKKMYTQIQVVALLSSIYLITRHHIPVSKKPFYIHKTHVLFSQKHGSIYAYTYW
jgi:hypothetical protein